MKISQCHLANGPCKPTLQSRTPFAHSWLCRLWFTPRWWDTHCRIRTGWFGFQAVLLQDQEWSSVLPQLFPGNGSALLSLTWINHTVWGSSNTPRVVFLLGSSLCKAQGAPRVHPTPANPLECVQLDPPPKLHCAPGFLCAVCSVYPGLHSPQRDTSKGTKDIRYEKLQVWLCRKMIYWCWELNLVIRHYLKREKTPTRPWTS